MNKLFLPTKHFHKAYLLLIPLFSFISYGLIFNNSLYGDDFGLLEQIRSGGFLNVFSFRSVWSPYEYRPIKYLHIFFLYHIVGSNIVFHYAFSVLIHALNALLMFLIGQRFLKNSFYLLCASLFFIAFRMIVEPIYWLGATDLLLMPFYSLIAFYFLISDLEEPKLYKVGLFGLFFSLALFTTEMAVGLVVLFPLYAVLFRGEGKRPFSFLIKRYGWYLFIFGLYTFCHFAVRGVSEAENFYMVSFGWHIFVNIAAYFRHFLTFIFTHVHPDQWQVALSDHYPYLWADLPLIVTVVLFLICRKEKKALFLLLWFALSSISIAIVSGGLMFASRLVYFMAIPAILFVAIMMENIFSVLKFKKVISILIFSLYLYLLIMNIGLTRLQDQIFEQKGVFVEEVVDFIMREAIEVEGEMYALIKNPSPYIDRTDIEGGIMYYSDKHITILWDGEKLPVNRKISIGLAPLDLSNTAIEFTRLTHPLYVKERDWYLTHF